MFYKPYENNFTFDSVSQSHVRLLAAQILSLRHDSYLITKLIKRRQGVECYDPVDGKAVQYDV